MKRHIIVVGLVLVVGCASFEQNTYKAVGSLAVTVEQARQAYVALYDAGKITPATKATVEKAYADYQKAMAVLQASLSAYRADKSQAPVTAAMDVLSAAVAAFLKATGQP
jgi:predicted lipoprotein